MDDEQFDFNDLPDEVYDVLSEAADYVENYAPVRITDDVDRFLGVYRVPELKNLAKMYGFKRYSKYKKDELIKLIRDSIMDEDEMESHLLTLSDLGYQTLRHKVFQKETLSVVEMASIEYLTEDGYLAQMSDDSLYMAQPVLDTMKKIFRRKSFREQRKKKAYLYALMHYADYLYGVADENMMLMMYQTRFKNVSKQEFMNLYHELGQPFMTYQDHEFISYTVLDQDAYEIVKDLHRRYVMSLPAKEELMDFMNYGYPYSLQEYRNFFNLMIIYFGVEPLRADHMIQTIFYAISVDDDLQQLTDYMAAQVDMNDIEMWQMFMELYMHASNASRHFRRYGNIPSVLMRNKLESGGSIPLPDDPKLRAAVKARRAELNEEGYDFDDEDNIVLKDKDNKKGGFFS